MFHIVRSTVHQSYPLYVFNTLLSWGNARDTGGKHIAESVEATLSYIDETW